jgi:predicted nucleic acid-binding protein
MREYSICSICLNGPPGHLFEGRLVCCLNETIPKVISNYGLRGFDAIHLSSAITIKTAIMGNFLFACFDERLRRAAQSEGMQTLPE